jgi:hypothetical protein
MKHRFFGLARQHFCRGAPPAKNRGDKVWENCSPGHRLKWAGRRFGISFAGKSRVKVSPSAFLRENGLVLAKRGKTQWFGVRPQWLGLPPRRPIFHPRWRVGHLRQTD